MYLLTEYLSDNYWRYLSKRINNYLYVFFERKCVKIEVRVDYFKGMYIELRDAPMPGFPCRTGVFVIENSPVK